MFPWNAPGRRDENGEIARGPSGALVDAADLYAALADRNRRRILEQVRQKERSVSELVRALRMRQPLVSHHLKVLMALGILDARKEGRYRLYRISSPLLAKRLQSLDVSAAEILGSAQEKRGD